MQPESECPARPFPAARPAHQVLPVRFLVVLVRCAALERAIPAPAPKSLHTCTPSVRKQAGTNALQLEVGTGRTLAQAGVLMIMIWPILPVIASLSGSLNLAFVCVTVWKSSLAASALQAPKRLIRSPLANPRLIKLMTRASRPGAATASGIHLRGLGGVVQTLSDLQVPPLSGTSFNLAFVCASSCRVRLQ